MNVPLYTVAGLLAAHWVGDYLLQGNSMAARKSSSLKWLSFHVLTYTLALFAASWFFFGLPRAFSFAIINGALHWITDLFTGKLSSVYKKRPRVYFPIVGFDQFIHTFTILATAPLDFS